ncbi:uncharacterized protein CLUP02_12423 [Colletotrichum lupini]|uniref:Uncharacterized protein n=1 Tax=Colletotrichum lupini TaxID=145971 RepID=A0A9Q8T2A3_9PEZI|nr:uncharacterized protein CLUP02_12423 [Colletotrichum lupini]UQC86921.1 hypothetical protein CLUP02_12423 [Colletotrichum lupini]
MTDRPEIRFHDSKIDVGSRLMLQTFKLTGGGTLGHLCSHAATMCGYTTHIDMYTQLGAYLFRTARKSVLGETERQGRDKLYNRAPAWERRHVNNPARILWGLSGGVAMIRDAGQDEEGGGEKLRASKAKENGGGQLRVPVPSVVVSVVKRNRSRQWRGGSLGGAFGDEGGRVKALASERENCEELRVETERERDAPLAPVSTSTSPPYGTYLRQLGNFPGLLISSRLPPPPTTLEYNAEFTVPSQVHHRPHSQPFSPHRHPSSLTVCIFGHPTTLPQEGRGAAPVLEQELDHFQFPTATATRLYMPSREVQLCKCKSNRLGFCNARSSALYEVHDPYVGTQLSTSDTDATIPSAALHSLPCKQFVHRPGGLVKIPTSLQRVGLITGHASRLVLLLPVIGPTQPPSHLTGSFCYLENLWLHMPCAWPAMHWTGMHGSAHRLRWPLSQPVVVLQNLKIGGHWLRGGRGATAIYFVLRRELFWKRSRPRARAELAFRTKLRTRILSPTSCTRSGERVKKPCWLAIATPRQPTTLDARPVKQHHTRANRGRFAVPAPWTPESSFLQHFSFSLPTPLGIMVMAFSTPVRYAVCLGQVGTVERLQLDMPSSLRGAALKRPAVLSSWLATRIEGGRCSRRNSNLELRSSSAYRAMNDPGVLRTAARLSNYPHLATYCYLLSPSFPGPSTKYLWIQRFTRHSGVPERTGTWVVLFFGMILLNPHLAIISLPQWARTSATGLISGLILDVALGGKHPSRFLRYLHQQDIQSAIISTLPNVQEPEDVKQRGRKYDTVLGGYPLRLGVFSVQENDNDPDGASLFVLSCSRVETDQGRSVFDHQDPAVRRTSKQGSPGTTSFTALMDFKTELKPFLSETPEDGAGRQRRSQIKVHHSWPGLYNAFFFSILTDDFSLSHHTNLEAMTMIRLHCVLPQMEGQRGASHAKCPANATLADKSPGGVDADATIQRIPTCTLSPGALEVALRCPLPRGALQTRQKQTRWSSAPGVRGPCRLYFSLNFTAYLARVTQLPPLMALRLEELLVAFSTPPAFSGTSNPRPIPRRVIAVRQTRRYVPVLQVELISAWFIRLTAGYFQPDPGQVWTPSEQVSNTFNVSGLLRAWCYLAHTSQGIYPSSRDKVVNNPVSLFIDKPQTPSKTAPLRCQVSSGHSRSDRGTRRLVKKQALCLLSRRYAEKIGTDDVKPRFHVEGNRLVETTMLEGGMPMLPKGQKAVALLSSSTSFISQAPSANHRPSMAEKLSQQTVTSVAVARRAGVWSTLEPSEPGAFGSTATPYRLKDLETRRPAAVSLSTDPRQYEEFLTPSSNRTNNWPATRYQH